jgi:hypothetical protein
MHKLKQFKVVELLPGPRQGKHGAPWEGEDGYWTGGVLVMGRICEV